MLRKMILGLALAGILLETGCSTCGCHPLFSHKRRCDDCNNGATALPPTSVPVVPPPPGAIAPPPAPPPVSAGYGPTPDMIVTQRPSSGCGCGR